MLFNSPLLLAFLSISCHVSAAPRSNASGRVMMLNRRTPSDRTEEEWGTWAKSHKQGLESKYDTNQLQKRSTGTNLLTNQGGDSSYFGSIAIGTPPVAYNVILDTGSADLWVADSQCLTGCTGVPLFNPSASSTYKSTSTPFNITYGSGRASGTLGQDNVQMAGFSVSNQMFGVCNLVSQDLLTNPVSGLLGLAFITIASSKAMPFWQTLVSSGAWDQPLMAFHLTRYVNDTSFQQLEPGGSFDMGFTNSSLYTGDIEYVSTPGEGTYWILPMTSIIVQGNTINIPSGQSSYSAIDTGTTLVGGPQEYISQIFSQIPGSQPGTGNFEGYYTYPCDTDVTVQLSFGGGKSWTISPADFKLTTLSRNQCLGAFFELSTGRSTPSWIVGDTFLKNVYSVFKYNPPSVGFAQLSDIANAESGSNSPVPSPTIGSAAATVSATAGLSGSSSNAAIVSSQTSSVVIASLIMFWVTGVCTSFL